MGLSTFATAAAALLIAGALPCAAHASEISGEVDLLELHVGKGSDHLVMESTFAFGKGADQFVLKVDGGSDARTAFDSVQVQALYSRALSDKVAVLVGARRDFRAGADLNYAALGIEASLTDWLDVEHYVYLSEHNDLTGAGKVTARWALGKRLALEPRVMLNWSARAVPAEALGAGVNDFEGSVRLRREIGSHADLYIGYAHEHLFGQTRRIAVAAGQAPIINRAIVGMGLKF
ncbi:MAG: copper resistance protein B [Novosphingobium sp.]